MYGDPTEGKEPSSGSEEVTSSQEATLDKDDIDNESMAEEGEPKKESSDLQDLYTDIPLILKQKDHSGTCRLLRFPRQLSDEDEEEDDYDYSPDEEEEWKKTIMVGKDYQARIPDGLCKYDDALPYENRDEILWDPKPIEESELEKFLIQAQEPHVTNSQGISTPVRDEEQALYLLLQCGHQEQEALRRCRMNVAPPLDTMSLWSEEECRNFVNGLRMYGKNFHLIQQNKVQTRSVAEIIQFYYLWKKTDNKPWYQKKKYNIFAGTKFVDEQENPGSSRGRHSSQNVHNLIYSDPKRQKRVQERMADTHNHPVSPSDTSGDMDEQLDSESIELGTSIATSAGENASKSESNSGASVSALGPEGSNGGEITFVSLSVIAIIID